MSNKKNIKRLYNIAVITVMVLALGYVCSRFVHWGRVEYTDDAQVWRHITPLNARVGGFIKEIRFEDYQQVKKGDTLVIIEDAEYQLALAQAEANLKGSRSGASAVSAGMNTTASNVRVAAAGIEQAGQQKQSTALVVSEQQQRLSQTHAGASVAEAAVNLARLNLSYTVIVATCDGVMSRKDIHVGQLVQPGQQLASIVDNNQVWVVANYRETQMKHVAPGNKVEIKADAIPNVTYIGEVESIAGGTGSAFSKTPVDNATGNFVKVEQRVPVRIRLTGDNKPEDIEKLLAGLNVETEVMY